MLSFGYAEDTRRVAASLPKLCQTLLLSATLSDDVRPRVVLLC